MPVLLFLGMLSALFFSTTFLLNRMMSLAHGHWIWSASLRYFFMIAMVALVIVFWEGVPTLKGVLALFRRFWRFWIVAGSIGFGGFYAFLCYAADFAQGWVVATTWQVTVIASLVVLIAFGKRFAKRIWFFCALILLGVTLVNLASITHFNWNELLKGFLPVLAAAFCYPIGNQLVWEAKHQTHSWIPHIDDPLMHNAFHKVLLLSLGSVPFWLVLIVCGNSAAALDFASREYRRGRFFFRASLRQHSFYMREVALKPVPKLPRWMRRKPPKSFLR